jgi:hypothetical protein
MCLCAVRGVRPEPVEGCAAYRVPHPACGGFARHIIAPVPHPLCDGSRMSSVAIVFDLGNTCPDESFARTVYTVSPNPVIERIVTTASPIDLATIADVCDVGDSMEERPLFPVTRSRFRLPWKSRMSRSDCVWRISCPVRALGDLTLSDHVCLRLVIPAKAGIQRWGGVQECVSAALAIPAKTATLDNLRTAQRDRTDCSSVLGKRKSRFAGSLTY